MATRVTQCLVGLFLLLIILFILLLTSGAATADTTIDSAITRKKWWFAGYLGWTASHFGLGLASVILGVAGASKSSFSAETKTRLTLAAAVAAAALTFLNPSAQGKAYHQAWQALESSIRKFRANPPAATEADLNASIDSGEELIKKSGK